MQDGKWVRDLCTALSEQYDHYPNDPDMHRVIHRYVGTILSKVDSKAQVCQPLFLEVWLMHRHESCLLTFPNWFQVSTVLNIMLSKINHDNDVERIGLAQGNRNL